MQEQVKAVGEHNPFTKMGIALVLTIWSKTTHFSEQV